MAINDFLIFTICLLMSSALKETIEPEYLTYVRQARTQIPSILKTWTYEDINLFITVTKERRTLLNASLNDVFYKDQENRVSIQYNNSTKEVSLLLTNVTGIDEGLYQISTTNCREVVTKSRKKDITWNVQLSILEPSEIKQGSAGENTILMEFFPESIFYPRLYHNYRLIAVMRETYMELNITSSLYGRLRYVENENKSSIIINNVAVTDTGLYRLQTEERLIQQCFLNITGTAWDGGGSHSSSAIYYIIAVTMVAVVFTFLCVFGCLILIRGRNTKGINAGVFIEIMGSACGAAISTLGRSSHTKTRDKIMADNSKYLVNTVKSPCSLTDVFRCRYDVSSAKEREEVHFGSPNSDDYGRCQETRSADAIYAEVNNLSSNHNVNDVAYEIFDLTDIDNTVKGLHDVEHASSSGTPLPAFVDIGSGGVPVFVTLYVVGAVCVMSTINLIGWIIWCKRRKIHKTKEVRRIQHEQWKPDLYLTPTAFETSLPTATTETRNTDHSNSTHITMSIHMAQMVLMDVHDVVDISNDFDPEYTQEQEEIINVSTKNRTSPCSDVGGYLTVLAARDIAV